MPRSPSRPRFKRPQRPSRLRGWWLVWRVPVLALVMMSLWWFVLRPIAQEQDWTSVDEGFALCSGGGERQAGCVVDGDTVVMGFGSEQRRIRLTGYDAPELDGTCEAERQSADAARLALHRWLGEGPFEWSGGEDPPRDRYGRELREVRRVGADGGAEYLADTLIAADLAAESGWGATERDWCK